MHIVNHDEQVGWVATVCVTCDLGRERRRLHQHVLVVRHPRSGHQEWPVATVPLRRGIQRVDE